MSILRYLTGNAVKRKEIQKLTHMLKEKEKELSKALAVAEAHHKEATQYAKKANYFENELRNLYEDSTKKANSEIQKLSDHLEEKKAQYEKLQKDKTILEEKLEEVLSTNRDLMLKLQDKFVNSEEKGVISEFNKEYLEIHEKALQRARQEAQVQIVQLE